MCRFLWGPGLLHHHWAKSCMETFLPGRELQVSWGETEISEAGCCTCVRDRLLQGQPTCPALLKSEPRAIARHPVPDSSHSQMPKEDISPRKASSNTSPEIPDTSWPKDSASAFNSSWWIFHSSAQDKLCGKKHLLLFGLKNATWYFHLILLNITAAPSLPFSCHPEVTNLSALLQENWT